MGDTVISEEEFDKYYILLRESKHPDNPDFFGDHKGEVYIHIDFKMNSPVSSIILSIDNSSTFLEDRRLDVNARSTECEICMEQDQSVGIMEFPRYNMVVHQKCIQELQEDLEVFYENNSDLITSWTI